MFGEGKKIFASVMRDLVDETKSKKLLKKAESQYLMKSFKIVRISAEEAIQSYERLCQKYESEELKVLENEWHKNQRKLFIWFLICFSEEEKEPIQNFQDKKWRDLGQLFFGKNPLFLKFQGLSILKISRRHNWTPEDDDLLSKYVEEIGSNQWNEISKSIFFSDNEGKFISPKQCRERWFNHINQEVNKEAWSNSEDLDILRMVLEKGKKWSLIARILSTKRTEHMVKNRYNSLINRIKKKKMEKEEKLIHQAIYLLETKKDLSKIEESESPEEKIKQQAKNIKESQSTIEPQNAIIKDLTKLISKQNFREGERQGEEINLSNLPQGDISNLKNLFCNKMQGFITFNADESHGVETPDALSMSWTPSIKAISPMGPNFFGAWEKALAESGSFGFHPDKKQSFSPFGGIVYAGGERHGEERTTARSLDYQIPLASNQLSQELLQILQQSSSSKPYKGKD